MRATDILRNEHDVILRILAVLERIAKHAREHGVLEVDAAEKVLDFLGTFADRCHHAKEEDALFPMLARRGLPRDVGPLAVMLGEHESGRALRRRLVEAAADARLGRPGSGLRFAADAHALVELLRDHIAKENDVLFPMADGMLAEHEEREVLELYERHEEVDMQLGTHERYLALADELGERFGVANAPAPAGGHRCCGQGTCHG